MDRLDSGERESCISGSSGLMDAHTAVLSDTGIDTGQDYNQSVDLETLDRLVAW